MSASYTLNSRVSVHITGFIASGLLGQVNGTRAIIRNREIAWGQPLPVREYIGQTREAIVLGFNQAYQELELSLRLAERDPWPEAVRKYTFGTEVQGQVIGLMEDTAFVEIESGVEGVLHVSELLPQSMKRIEDWLWIEDHVKAMVVGADSARRRLRLSLKDLLTQREAHLQSQPWIAYQAASQETILAEALPKQVRLQLLRLESAVEPLIPEPLLKTLVIEDDETYATGLEGMLRCNGCQVTWAKDGMAGLAQVRSQTDPFHLILIDWNLPGLKGHQVVEQLQQDGCPSRLAMVLEPAPLRDYPEIWEVLRASGVDAFSKADEEACKVGLVSLIQEIRVNGFPPEKPRQRHFPEVTALSAEQALPSPVANMHLLSSGQCEGLEALLARLRRDTRATTVVLLGLDPGQRNLLAKGCSGKPFPVEKAPPDLIHGPLEDVLQKGQEVLERVEQDSSRFRRLLDILHFQGFLGIPLPGMEFSPYGLILLKEYGGFSPQDCRQARMATYLIAGALQERRLAQTLQPWQAQNLAGQLVSSMIHEVDNKLGGIRYQVESLQEKLIELSWWPEKAEDATFLRELEQAVEKIADAQREASRLRDQYLGLTASDEPQFVALKDLAEGIIRLLRAEAQYYNVLLIARLSENLPPVQARPSQLRQIFLNLTLNAIQQMAQLGRQGSLTIEISHCPEASRPIQVRFIDEGPGIHAQLWERIFDFGFTTKKRGAGLGLTISRQAATDLGGELRVEESHIFWGTAFLLELPKGA